LVNTVSGWKLTNMNPAQRAIPMASFSGFVMAAIMAS
jgi:hypothetical protein